MKRADLIVGVTLMYKSGKHDSGSPAKVLAVEPYRGAKHSWEQIKQVPNGLGVLVEVQEYRYSTAKREPVRKVVQLSTLYGPDYDTVAAQDEADRKAAEKARRDSAADAAQHRADQQRVLDRLKSAGVQNASPSHGYGYGITLSMADATTFAAMLEAEAQ